VRPLLALAVLLAACHRVPETSVVDSGVELFHQRLASGDDDAIFLDADPVYQRSVDRESNSKFLARVRRKLGMPGQVTRTFYSFAAGVANTQYDVNFTNGDATEIFFWRVKDGKATLMGYTINSPLMQTN
jgi:hypothetical protein